eukprot:3229703-Rhodomonas_salina.1
MTEFSDHLENIFQVATELQKLRENIAINQQRGETNVVLTTQLEDQLRKSMEESQRLHETVENMQTHIEQLKGEASQSKSAQTEELAKMLSKQIELEGQFRTITNLLSLVEELQTHREDLQEQVRSLTSSSQAQTEKVLSQMQSRLAELTEEINLELTDHLQKFRDDIDTLSDTVDTNSGTIHVLQKQVNEMFLDSIRDVTAITTNIDTEMARAELEDLEAALNPSKKR